MPSGADTEVRPPRGVCSLSRETTRGELNSLAFGRRRGEGKREAICVDEWLFRTLLHYPIGVLAQHSGTLRQHLLSSQKLEV